MNKLLLIFFFFLNTILFLYCKIEELNLTSDNGYYKESNNQKVFIAQGNAHILIDENDVYCDEVQIYLTKSDNVEKAIFKKNIIIFQEKDKVQIGGQYAEYYKSDKQFIIRENAFYIDVNEEVAVFGDSIHNYDKEEIAIIQGNVRIYQKEIFSKGAFVKYTRKNKLMEISGFPTVENQGSEYKAKKIVIDVANNTFLLEGGLEATILNETSDKPEEEVEKEDNKLEDKKEDKKENKKEEKENDQE